MPPETRTSEGTPSTGDEADRTARLDRRDHRDRPTGDPSRLAALRALVENVPNGLVVLFDSTMRVRSAGPDPLPLSGRAVRTVIGEPVGTLFPATARRTLEPVLQTALGGTPRTGEAELDGRVYRVAARPAAIAGDRFGVAVAQAVGDRSPRTRDRECHAGSREQVATELPDGVGTAVWWARAALDRYRETGDETALVTVADALSRIEALAGDPGVGPFRSDEPRGGLPGAVSRRRPR